MASSHQLENSGSFALLPNCDYLYLSYKRPKDNSEER